MEDEQGKKMNAVKVFSICIKYLMGHVMKTIKHRVTVISKKDVDWVLPVPAIWNDSSKQFMIEAAEMAGIKKDSLTIATEPEAASLFCMHLPIEQLNMTGASLSQSQMSPFSTGQHYMVVNAGGVTVDINVIELVGEGQLKVLNMNSGGPWGESRVDEAFQDFVRKLVGNLVFDEFKKTCVEDFDQLQRQSETKKRRDTKGKETINIPVALIEIYNSKTKKTMDEAVKQFKGHLSWTAGKLRVNCEFVRGWFKDTCDNIVKSVRDLFRQHGMFSCKTILLVGGFAESSVLQQAFRDNFPDKRLIVPEEAGLAVLKGAVLFGHLKPYLSTVHCSSDCYSEDKEKSTKPVQTIIVAAIDFGSAFSGYAFAVRDDLKIDSENPKISTGTGFVSGQMISHKTPTVLLLNPDKSFAAFGYAAEEKYSTLFEDDREQKTSSHRSYYYFRRLKMRLYSPDRPMTLSRDVEIQDEHGKRMKAIDVFSICIKHLATEFMKLGRNRLPDLTEDDVHWVLTVPAIWSDSSKQFMRVAAELAGLDGNRLTIALEPEAASLFCMRVPIKSQVEASATVSQFQEGTKYMVVDAGGGTIDVIVHEIVGDNKLKELTSASGGPWGGTLVDKEFDAFMETIFGKDLYYRFKNECVGDYIDLHRELELKKRNVNSNDDRKETFSLPFALLKLMDKEMDTLVDQRLQIYNGDVSLKNGKLRIASEIMRGWFKESCLKTTQHLKSILQQKVCAGTNTILLVGGYAESPMLQSEIKDAFRDKTVIIPDEAGLAVLKGAVLFGNDPLVVVSRIARCSYGICVFRDFDPRIHAQEKKTVIEGKLKCKDIFAKHVQRGDELTVGQAQLHQRYSKLEADQISFVLDIYTSTNADPRFVDDEDCTYLGCLEIEVPPEDSKDNGIKVNMTFGGTELEVEARDEKYGKTKKATFDFLVDNLNPQSKIAL
ncbi:heat shock 70 kDa protein 12A-like [Mya arenaria]|uniref:heat shock 70 kDa protein 12A-like n=1 Tax=Mya arenaria TaxID=6604 RepID=UPI0022E7F2B3|nr:heat shock 70 kDa protein 12A-like [Mya arenaria]